MLALEPSSCLLIPKSPSLTTPSLVRKMLAVFKSLKESKLWQMSVTMYWSMHMWNTCTCYIKVSAWQQFLKQHNFEQSQHTCARCCSHEYISKQRASDGRLLRFPFLPCPYPVLTSTEQESCNHNISKHNLLLISIHLLTQTYKL